MSEEKIQKKIIVQLLKNAPYAAQQAITRSSQAALLILKKPRSNSSLLNANLTQVRF
jgi:hypothetical protein